jgi:hypothetical protein
MWFIYQFLCAFSLTRLPTDRIAKSPHTEIVWDAGEVEWDFPVDREPSEEIYRISPIKLPIQSRPIKTDKEYIWQEIEVRATAAGVMKAILEETPLLNAIFLDADFKSEFDLFVILFMSLVMLTNKTSEIEYMRTIDIDKYMKTRKMASLWMVSMMIVFTKNVKEVF